MKYIGLRRLCIIDALNNARHFFEYHKIGVCSFKDQYRLYLKEAKRLINDGGL